MTIKLAKDIPNINSLMKTRGQIKDENKTTFKIRVIKAQKMKTS